MMRQMFLVAVLALFAVGCSSVPQANMRVVKSEPVGAEVFVNGKAVGKAPVVYNFLPNVDGYEIEAKLEGFVTEYRVFNRPQKDYIPAEIFFTLHNISAPKVSEKSKLKVP